MAIGVNTPFGWGQGSIAASVSVGITEHQAIRGNVASWVHDNALGEAIAVLSDGEGGEGSIGRTTDVGIGWTYFPDRLWSGFSVELGALYRHRDTTTLDDNASPAMLATRTGTAAGRALVGWSWLFYGHICASIAVGLSAGRESGTQTGSDDTGRMPVTTAVDRMAVSAEGFARIGFAFDL